MKTPISIFGVILDETLARRWWLGWKIKQNSERKKDFHRRKKIGREKKLELRAYFGPRDRWRASGIPIRQGRYESDHLLGCLPDGRRLSPLMTVFNWILDRGEVKSGIQTGRDKEISTEVDKRKSHVICPPFLIVFDSRNCFGLLWIIMCLQAS